MSLSEQIQHLRAELDREQDLTRYEPDRNPWRAITARDELRELESIAQRPPVVQTQQVQQ